MSSATSSQVQFQLLWYMVKVLDFSLLSLPHLIRKRERESLLNVKESTFTKESERVRRDTLLRGSIIDNLERFLLTFTGEFVN